MPSNFLENVHIVHCAPSGVCAAAEDFNAAGTMSDIISMKNAETCVFFIITLANLGGNSAISVQACDDVSATNTSNITFNVREISVGAATGGDTHGTISTNVALYTTTTAANYIYAIEVNQGALMASGYEFVRLVLPETTNAAIDGCYFALLTDLRYKPLTATQLS